MRKFLFPAVVIASAVSNVAIARTISLWDTDIDVVDPQPMTLSVGTLTDRAGGRHMNYVKLKNGHMMVLVPLEQYMGMAKMTGSDDMLR